MLEDERVDVVHVTSPNHLHHRHASARRDTAPRQLGSHSLRCRVKLAECQRSLARHSVGVLANQKMRALRVMGRAEAQNIDQRLCAKRSGFAGFIVEFLRHG